MPPIVNYPIALQDTPVLWRGDPFDWTLALADGINDDGSLINPRDLTGFGTTWTATARSTAGGDPVQWNVDASHAADGYLVLTLTDDQTQDLAREYQFDVQATGGARSPFTVWRGAFTADGDFTRG